MENPAQTEFPIHDLLARRWSSRAFAEHPVDMGTLKGLLEAAHWAPASNNEQPWRFIVATKDHEAEWTRLFNCLMAGNRTWAFRAPVLILSVVSTHFERNGQPNRHAFHDVGLATENLVLQKTASGLNTHQMAGVDVEKAREDLKIPVGYELVVIIAVGYPSVLPEHLQEREQLPRNRRPIHDQVFRRQWGIPIP